MDTPEPKIRRLHDQVVRTVALRIIRSETRAENSLPTEMELSQQLDVSRNVLREAIKVLVSKGMLEVRPKTGMRIRQRQDWSLFDPDVLTWLLEVGPDERFFQDILDVRSMVETAAAERAAQRATGEDIAELERCYQQMVDTVDDFETHVVADVNFHESILDACHNELLRHMSAVYSPALRASFHLTAQIPGGRAASLPSHKAVADAIARHNSTAARAAMEKLLNETANDLNRIFHLDKDR
jgi:GntR family transcriptional regulator, galactonate operon transcriptional repressor